MKYRVDFLTLFPSSIEAMMGKSIIGRAAEAGTIELGYTQIRDYSENKQMQVDDYPYGGGWGLVMNAQPLKSALDSIKNISTNRKTRVIYLSPCGSVFNQQHAKRLKNDYDHLVLICGHYEGIDERFINACVDEEISLGDFVLTGGEIAAMAVADSVLRLVDGVLADEECYTGESHWDGLLEYPQYTRPEVWEGRQVPPVLLGGNHEKICKWRTLQQIHRTKTRRADMFAKFKASDEFQKNAVEKLSGKKPKRPEFICRRAEKSDLDAIMNIKNQASERLKEAGVMQWQNGTPTKELFIEDIDTGSGWIFEENGNPAGYLSVKTDKDTDYEKYSSIWPGVEGSYIAVHRIMTSNDYVNLGLASEMLEFAEDICRGMGRESVRIDTHRDNKAMLALLNKNDYVNCGSIELDIPEKNDRMREAFCKLLWS